MTERDPTRFLLDPETNLTRETWAVIYAPRRQRQRFQANCVRGCDNEAQARAAADPAQSMFAARVIGPSRSSEGFEMYYLVRWLE